MAVIKHALAGTMARDAVVLDLADIARQARDLIADAAAKAERLVAEGEIERDRLIGTAAQEGIRRGHEEGFAAGYAEGARRGEAAARAEHAERLATISAAWERALGSFEAAREDMLLHARTDALALAIAVAERVTKRVAACDPGVAAAQMEAALRLITHPSRVVVAVCPDDLDHAKAELERLRGLVDAARHSEIVADASLSRGSVRVRSGRGVIDATIEAQLERVAAALLPGGAAAASDARPPAETGA